MVEPRIIRVFPRRTSMTPRDDMAFVGDPPMIRPEADEIHVSVTFSWDVEEGYRLAESWIQYYPVVELAGPALSSDCDGFISGQYVRPGVTFTSRGCNNQCPWCLVPKREGKLREMTSFSAGYLIQDNNFLQCNRGHRDQVFQMLRGQSQIQFAGGVDARLLTDRIGEQIRGLRIAQVFLACDTDGGLKALQGAVQRLALPRDKVRCYVLLALNGESMSQGIARLEDVWAAGAMPFA